MPKTGAPIDSDGVSAITFFSERGIVNCALCNAIISDLFTALANNVTDEEIAAGIGQRCETLNLYNFKVCNGTAAIAMVERTTLQFYDNF